MRTLIQRVQQAKVTVDGRTTGEIGAGLLVLAAFRVSDTEDVFRWMARKIVQLRIFNDTDGKMNLSLEQVQGSILVVSQFTLYADSRKGNRPSYIDSAPPDKALPLYNQFVAVLKSEFSGKVECGEFGADMKVSLVNDGPVTIWLEREK